MVLCVEKEEEVNRFCCEARLRPHYSLSREIELVCSYYLRLSSDSVALAYVIIGYDKVIVCTYNLISGNGGKPNAA